MINNLITERSAPNNYKVSYSFNGVHNRVDNLGYDNMIELVRMILSSQIGFKVDTNTIIKYVKENRKG